MLAHARAWRMRGPHTPRLTHLTTRPKPPDPISSSSLYSLYSHWWGRGVMPPAALTPGELSSDMLLLAPRLGSLNSRTAGGGEAPAPGAACRPVVRADSAPELAPLHVRSAAAASPAAAATWSASNCQPAGGFGAAGNGVRVGHGAARAAVTGRGRPTTDPPGAPGPQWRQGSRPRFQETRKTTCRGRNTRVEPAARRRGAGPGAVQSTRIQGRSLPAARAPRVTPNAVSPTCERADASSVIQLRLHFARPGVSPSRAAVRQEMFLR
jgi:hypothetical protein